MDLRDLKTFLHLAESRHFGRTEADPLNGKISDESPVGHGLLGKAVGEEAEILLPSGQTVIYKVLSITHAKG